MRHDTAREIVQRHLSGSAEVQRQVAEACVEDIIRAADLVVRSVSQGGQVLICGNGGSAADAEHLAAEFLNRLTKEFARPPIPAIALTSVPFLTAYANDVGYEGVFARQVEALGRSGDVLLCISTSGESGNVLRAAEEARKRGVRTVALTGAAGALAGAVDVAIRIPSRDTQHIQEAHLGVEHVLCHLIERRLYGERGEGQEHPAAALLDSDG